MRRLPEGQAVDALQLEINSATEPLVSAALKDPRSSKALSTTVILNIFSGSFFRAAVCARRRFLRSSSLPMRLYSLVIGLYAIRVPNAE